MGSRTLALLGAFLGLAVAPQAAFAVPVPTIDIENPTVIDATAGTDLTLTTTGDIYVYVPDGLFSDQLTINAADQLIIETGVALEQNDPLICDSGCVLESYDLAGDVVLNIFDPLGTVLIDSGSSILISTLPIPEPGTALLLGAGLALLARLRKL